MLKWWKIRIFGLWGGFGWISATSWMILIILAVKTSLLYQLGENETGRALQEVKEEGRELPW
jgi:hypothetical protein